MMMNNKFANSETILRAINEAVEEFETGSSVDLIAAATLCVTR